jgi:hypothetical protein
MSPQQNNLTGIETAVCPERYRLKSTKNVFDQISGTLLEASENEDFLNPAANFLNWPGMVIFRKLSSLLSQNRPHHESAGFPENKIQDPFAPGVVPAFGP